MTPISIAAWIAVLLGYVLLRLYAARRVGSGDTKWLWVSLSLPIVTGLILFGVAIGFIRTSPLMSLLMGGLGLFIAAMAVIYVRRSIRAMAPATTPAQRADALIGPLSDYMLAMMAFGLLSALVLGIGLVVLAISGQL